MIDVLKRVLYTGVGIASMTREKLVELGQEVSRYSDMTEGQAKEFEAELLKKGEEARTQLESEIDRRVEQVLQRLGVARNDQLAALTARVEALEKQVPTTAEPLD